MNTFVSMDNLFDLYRFRNQQDFAKVLLYFPFGFLLLLFRLAICVLTWPFLVFLPKTSKKRRTILKGTCLAFGVFVKSDIRSRDDNVKLLVCNHISVLDHIALESALPCEQVSSCSHFSQWYLPALFTHTEGQFPNETVSNRLDLLEHCTNVSDLAVSVFPEDATTNGRYGLLKFNTLPFDMKLPVQPVVIELSHVSFISISPSVIGTSAWSDLLWLLFVPYTVFTLRVLPALMKLENESVDDFSKRVQAVMASALNILPTEYTARNKAEYEQSLTLRTASQAGPLQSALHQTQVSEVNKMAYQVKEILPHVPLTIILQDLGITKCVDETIFRILEGVVHYTPENTPSSSSEHASSSRISGSDAEKLVLPSLNTADRSFGKTPKERMISYQERKAALMKAAKMRYFEKHGLIH